MKLQIDRYMFLQPYVREHSSLTINWRKYPDAPNWLQSTLAFSQFSLKLHDLQVLLIGAINEAQFNRSSHCTALYNRLVLYPHYCQGSKARAHWHRRLQLCDAEIEVSV